MGRYTKEDIFRIIEEKDVKFIRLQFTDIFGTLKNVAITTSQVKKALDNECMFDGSSIEGFVRIEESDMYLRPDLDTFTLYPWHSKQMCIRDSYGNQGGEPVAAVRRGNYKLLKFFEDNHTELYDLCLLYTSNPWYTAGIGLGIRRSTAHSLWTFPPMSARWACPRA